jgi:hypothetical protein
VFTARFGLSLYTYFKLRVLIKGIVVKVTLGHVCLRVLQFPPDSTVPPIPHSVSPCQYHSTNAPFSFPCQYHSTNAPYSSSSDNFSDQESSPRILGSFQYLYFFLIPIAVDSHLVSEVNIAIAIVHKYNQYLAVSWKVTEGWRYCTLHSVISFVLKC